MVLILSNSNKFNHEVNEHLSSIWLAFNDKNKMDTVEIEKIR